MYEDFIHPANISYRDPYCTIVLFDASLLFRLEFCSEIPAKLCKRPQRYFYHWQTSRPIQLIWTREVIDLV
jgi:hypothetical protein